MHVLEIHNLRFRYADASHPNGWIVNVHHLALERGQQMLLSGSSGRGKSTLLHLIAGLIDPGEGSVIVDGQRITDLHGAKRDLLRGSRIGMIFQTFNLLHGFSAEENVMAALMFSDPKKFPRSGHRERARQLLAHLGIERPQADPDRLSVGQQQRVAVARAIACDPVLVLADEPTASLDPESAGIAMDLIQQSCREINAALLCVSHDPTMAQRFERRASLDQLAADGMAQA
jgi:putative ABC transport system ATP-binding protein